MSAPLSTLAPCQGATVWGCVTEPTPLGDGPPNGHTHDQGLESLRPTPVPRVVRMEAVAGPEALPRGEESRQIGDGPAVTRRVLSEVAVELLGEEAAGITPEARSAASWSPRTSPMRAPERDRLRIATGA